jgi:hypothetical protein
MSAELARRSAYCRSNAPKKSFAQEHLERWAVEHRSELSEALHPRHGDWPQRGIRRLGAPRYG